MGLFGFGVVPDGLREPKMVDGGYLLDLSTPTPEPIKAPHKVVRHIYHDTSPAATSMLPVILGIAGGVIASSLGGS